MGFLRFCTKNTFVEVDVSNIDGSSKDARKIQSWGGPASSPIVLEECSTDCSDEEVLSEADDWDTENADRLTTIFHDDAMDGHSKVQTASPRPCDSERRAPSAPSLDVSTIAPISPSLQPTNFVFLQGPFVVSPMLVAPQAAQGSYSLRGVAAATSCDAVNFPQKSDVKTREASESFENLNSAWTCRMIRNIPNDYTRQDFLDLLHAYNVAYNFVYLPMDWNKAANLGYAFVNLVSHEEALRTGSVLRGFTAWKFQSQKVCDVVWGKSNLQSLQRITDKFRNNAIMHPEVPDTYKPMVFRDGHRVAFPDPTVQLQKPRGCN